jgi:hypothetical protein
MHVSYADALGSSDLVQVADSIFLITVRGFLTEPNIRVLQAGVDAMRLEEPYVGFYDYDAVTGYAPEAQHYAELWGHENRDRVRNFHLLTTVPLVLLGTHMINQHFDGKLLTYEDREEFYSVLAKEHGLAV